MTFWRQTIVLLQKNVYLAKRNWGTTTLKLIPGVVGMLIFSMVISPIWNTSQTHPKASDYINSIPKCKPVPSHYKCVTLLYSPDTAETREILRILATHNDPPLELGIDIQPTNLTVEPLKNYLYYNASNTTQGAVYFLDGGYNTTACYLILYNNSQSFGANQLEFNGAQGAMNNFRLQMHAAVEQALVRYMTRNEAASMKVRLKDTPRIIYQAQVGNTEDSNYSRQAMAVVFVYITPTIIMLLAVNAMLAEKEQNLRGFLTSVGLQEGSYWLSWFLWLFGIYLVSISSMLFFGYVVFPNMCFFSNTNFFVPMLSLSVYGVQLVTFSFLCSVLFTSIRGANIFVGFVFTTGLAFVMTFAFLGPLVYHFWKIGLEFYVFLYLTYLWPTFLFGKVLVDISIRSVGDPTNWGNGNTPSQHVPGYRIHDLTQHYYKSTPSTGETLLAMCVISAFYFLLAWYLEYVAFDSRRSRQPLLFFLQPSFWQSGDKPLPSHVHIQESSRQLIDNHMHEGLVISRLSKKYRGEKRFALKDVELQLKPKSVLAILGPNAAGKTTLLNMICGMTSPTAGDAFLDGRSTTKDVHAVQKLIGVCPQTSVYWPELSAREHLMIISGLKGLPRSEIEHDVALKLGEVRLTKVADYPLSTYSGGMKRRLSVALSLVGNPALILLDEPTTGVDAMNRLHIWKIIQNIKRRSTILLVTHSHDEAKALGDRIAIIMGGELKYSGLPQEIKLQLGGVQACYTLHLLVEVSQADQLKAALAAAVLETSLVLENAGSLVFSFPVRNDQQQEIMDLFEFLQKSPGVRDWRLSSTTIEDVLLMYEKKKDK